MNPSDDITTAICPDCGLIYMYRPAIELMERCLSCQIDNERKHANAPKGQTFVIKAAAKRAKSKARSKFYWSANHERYNERRRAKKAGAI